MPVPVDFDIQTYIGNTETVTVTWKDSSGSALNLTSYAIAFDCRDNSIDPVVSLGLTEGSGVTVTNAAGGIFTVTITAAQSSLLGERGKLKQYFYEINATTGATVTTVMKGFLKIHGD